MAPAPVIIDTSDDFGFVPPAKSVSSRRNLILAPPSVAAHEEQLHAVFATLDRSASDLQMLDRLSAGLVPLPSDAYDFVLVLTGPNGGQRQEALQLLSRDLYTRLVPSMKSGGKLQLQDGPMSAAEAREAILAGLVQQDGVFVKIEEEEVVVPLRFGKKKANGASNGASNGALNGSAGAVQPIQQPVQISLDDDFNSDDELIDEDNLMTADDLKRPIIQPVECRPQPGKRRRACKDCTCGLAEKMNAEDQERKDNAAQQLNVLKLGSEELYDELDFTVQGKTGSCNSCSLGDAFRCATCPYIGLPPFKPGEEVKILNDTVQL